MTFRVIKVEIDDSGNAIESKQLPSLCETKIDAEQLAEQASRSHGGKHGYDEENDYWWCRDVRGNKYRFFVKAVS